MRHKINLSLFILLFVCDTLRAQMQQFNFKRALSGISKDWHRLVLPDGVYAKVNRSFSDIRIYGINGTDTIEAPYLIQSSVELFKDEVVPFQLLNQTNNADGYYYTFKINADVNINEIELEFAQDNFDWKIKLEGSNDQKQWFTIVNNYRILSINNTLTDYTFSTVQFPEVKYSYFRLLVKSKDKPELVTPKIIRAVANKGSYKKYNTSYTIKKTGKESVVEIKLDGVIPVSKLKVGVNSKYDYYRNFQVAYLVDSTKTQKGWIKNYSDLMSGTLSSLEKNEFVFEEVLTNELKITVDNNDNAPLSIDSLVLLGVEKTLMSRIEKPAQYYLFYGSNTVNAPQYDIANFADKIPVDAPQIQIGEEQSIPKILVQGPAPLFKNKMWLWAIMGIIIVVLGGFSLRMIRKQ